MTEKQKREKIRSEISKQYRDEIAELKRQIHLRDNMILRMRKDIDDLKKQKTKLPLHLEAVRRTLSIIACAVISLLTGCAQSTNVATPSDALTPVLGFLTVDGEGIASHPFSREPEYIVEWAPEQEPEWTALPIWVSGKLEDAKIYEAVPSGYKYTIGTNDAADAYYNVIVSGIQQNFETLWTEVYAKLNGEVEFEEINAEPLAEIIDYIHGDEKYGTLIDTVTDGLMVIKDINKNGPSEEYDYRAYTVYQDFYAWLSSFTTDDLVKN